ncbi:hypothetical protein ARMSODRAFT_1025123 [Armillaria solidipes]|uniref:Uncharacterized protein n=1 Tax=Armillaria solidipes TaxID=1076256 RepID=A0A2H3AU27_9AGAR|nr:hypothetical protein ARMSODRAFT_1025123 [Armillaria solidipes]
MDNLTLQESWAQLFIPTYRIILQHGKVSLDAYLHGLFIAYHDRFRYLLGVPENPTDISSVCTWKHHALTSLAHLMLRVHNNHSITMTSSLAPTTAPLIPSPESRTHRRDMPIPSVPELQLSTEELVKISEEIPPQDDLSSEAAPKATNEDNVHKRLFLVAGIPADDDIASVTCKGNTGAGNEPHPVRVSFLDIEHQFQAV